MFIKVLLCVSLAVVLVAGDNCVQQECPEGNPSTILFPNPRNCSMFIQCSHGYANDMTCPPGLHFNAEELVCDFDWRANCKECDPE